MDDMTECYNCFPQYDPSTVFKGDRFIYNIPGCDLCNEYGNGFGKINIEYRYKPIEIEVKNVIKKFEPPPYECLLCKDTKQIKVPIFDKDLFKEDSEEDPEDYMPTAIVACLKCRLEEHEKEYEIKEEEYFKNK